MPTPARARRLLLACTAVLSLGVPTLWADQPAPAPNQSKYEIRFMTEMIDRHMMAVMMAQTCLTRAFHSELLQTCEQIIASQTQEIQTMQSWLRDWYGISYSPEMNPGMQQPAVRRFATLWRSEIRRPSRFADLGVIRRVSHPGPARPGRPLWPPRAPWRPPAG